MIQSVCCFQALGLGLGGDMAASAFCGHLAPTSLILALVTFIGGLVAAIRSHGPSGGGT